jgi:hypothetical protein
VSRCKWLWLSGANRTGRDFYGLTEISTNYHFLINFNSYFYHNSARGTVQACEYSISTMINNDTVDISKSYYEFCTLNYVTNISLRTFSKLSSIVSSLGLNQILSTGRVKRVRELSESCSSGHKFSFLLNSPYFWYGISVGKIGFRNEFLHRSSTGSTFVVKQIFQLETLSASCTWLALELS